MVRYKRKGKGGGGGGDEKKKGQTGMQTADRTTDIK